MAEWFKAQSWKDCLSVTVTRVQIPFSPLKSLIIFYIIIFANLQNKKWGEKHEKVSCI